MKKVVAIMFAVIGFFWILVGLKNMFFPDYTKIEMLLDTRGVDYMMMYKIVAITMPVIGAFVMLYVGVKILQTDD